VLEIEERAVKLRERQALEEIALTGGTTVFPTILNRAWPRRGVNRDRSVWAENELPRLLRGARQPLAVHLDWMRSRGWGKAWVNLPHDGAPGDKIFAITRKRNPRSRL
jgi:hypothetical protein